MASVAHARTVRFLNDGSTQSGSFEWEFAGRQRRTDDAGEPVAHPEDLEHCAATDLKFALGRALGESGSLGVSDPAADPDSDVEESPLRSQISFALSGNDLVMRLIHFSQEYFDDEAELRSHVEGILAPLLDRNRMWLASAEHYEYQKAGPWQIETEGGFHSRGKTLGNLHRVGLDAVALLEAIDNGDFGRESIADLLRSGHARALIGQAENEWLEAKREHHDLTSRVGEIKMARAVARFANAEHGGLVIVGLETKNNGTGDVIRKITPVPHDRKIVHKYRQILDRRLFPPPDDLHIAAIADGGGTGDLILIDIPPQPAELKPFLVHGAVIGGKADEAFISIVRRRGDSSIPTSPAAIHMALAAGRALLARDVICEVQPGRST
jgi:hypothetical protein